MDIRKVKKLIELLEESNVAEIEIKEGEDEAGAGGLADVRVGDVGDGLAVVTEAGGEGEELTERTVRDRYLVGVLAPSRSADAAATPVVDEEEDEEIPLIPDELSEGAPMDHSLFPLLWTA